MKSMNFWEEIWKDVENFEGIYEVSNYGRIKSLKRIVSHSGSYSGTKTVNERILKQSIDSDGYNVVSLNSNGSRKQGKVHRLVANAFIINWLNCDQVNHKDCDKTNNKYWNLEWCTNLENINHAVTNGLMRSGEDIHTCKVSDYQVSEIRAINRYKKKGHRGLYPSYRQIGEIYNLSKVQVGNIIRGDSRTLKGVEAQPKSRM